MIAVKGCLKVFDKEAWHDGVSQLDDSWTGNMARWQSGAGGGKELGGGASSN